MSPSFLQSSPSTPGEWFSLVPGNPLLSLFTTSFGDKPIEVSETERVVVGRRILKFGYVSLRGRISFSLNNLEVQPFKSSGSVSYAWYVLVFIQKHNILIKVHNCLFSADTSKNCLGKMYFVLGLRGPEPNNFSDGLGILPEEFFLSKGYKSD